MGITLGLIHWNISYGVGKTIRRIPRPSTNKTFNEIYKPWGVNELISLGKKGFQEKIFNDEKKTFWISFCSRLFKIKIIFSFL